MKIVSFDREISLIENENGARMFMKNGELFNLDGTPTSGRNKAHKFTPDQMQRANALLMNAGQPTPQQATTTTTTPAQAQPAQPDKIAAAMSAFMSMFGGSNDNETDAKLNALREEMTAYIDSAVKGVKPACIDVRITGETRRVEGMTSAYFEKCASALANHIAVYMYGAAGCGKSHTAAQLAQALGVEFYPCSQVLFEHKLTGFVDALGKFHETPLYQSLKNENGGLFFIDELDASDPSALITINSILANGYCVFANGERVEMSDRWYAVAAGNTIGRGAGDGYTGRAALDVSTLDRFVPVRCTYDKRVEIALSHDNSDLVEFIHDVRAAVAAANIDLPVSYRAISTIVRLEGSKAFTLPELVESVIFKGIARDDIQQVCSNLTGRGKYTDAARRLA